MNIVSKVLVNRAVTRNSGYEETMAKYGVTSWPWCRTSKGTKHNRLRTQLRIC